MKSWAQSPLSEKANKWRTYPTEPFPSPGSAATSVPYNADADRKKLLFRNPAPDRKLYGESSELHRESPWLRK